MTAPSSQLELVDYDGKKVSLLLKDAEEPTVGVVASASDDMIAFKPKGTTALTLIRAEDIVQIEAVIVDDEMKARRLNLANLDTVKRHLVDRHGYALADINAMSVEEAFSFHEGLDHAPLSHYHADPPAKKESESDED